MNDWIDALSSDGPNNGHGGPCACGTAHFNLWIGRLVLQCLRDYLANILGRMARDLNAPCVGHKNMTAAIHL